MTYPLRKGYHVIAFFALKIFDYIMNILPYLSISYAVIASIVVNKLAG